MHIRAGIDISASALQNVCERYNVHELWLFGSSARGSARPDSDVDLLVQFEPGARVGFLEMAGLQEELSEILNKPVDLVPKNGLKAVIRDSVLAEARSLYLAA